MSAGTVELLEWIGTGVGVLLIGLFAVWIVGGFRS